ncbi:MAG: tRNA dihydrouridine(20/20a) synthase DusA [Alphaproteobacteria bacterium]|nr:tRNA dihydrouridine(20/20a) synthase DusA [Alphaproteobacteria bacterium]
MNQAPAPPLDRRFAVAPMLEVTDRHCRYFLRLLSRRALLYTEMLSVGAILNGDRQRLLDFDPIERPLALQVGGSEPAAMAEAARLAGDWGYDEININCGCPSARVRHGRFGACLMAAPKSVARAAAAMRRACRLPVTVKCRIGIDDRDDYAFLRDFVDRVADAGVGVFIVHARKAVLGGLTPKQNREIPPLDYEMVRRLKADRPDLAVVLNGGLSSLDQAAVEAAGLDGVMLGRQVYETPCLLAEVDRRLHGDERPAPARADVVEAMRPYLALRLAEGVPLHLMTRHLSGLYHGLPGARGWRRQLNEAAARPGAGLEVLAEALALVEPQAAGRQAA